MFRRLFVALSLAVALGAAAITASAPEAQAKCKFGCGLAIGLGAAVLGSAIVESNRDRGYRARERNYYDGGGRGCRHIRRSCARQWGWQTRRFYRCARYEGC